MATKSEHKLDEKAPSTTQDIQNPTYSKLTGQGDSGIGFGQQLGNKRSAAVVNRVLEL